MWTFSLLLVLSLCRGCFCVTPDGEEYDPSRDEVVDTSDANSVCLSGGNPDMRSVEAILQSRMEEEARDTGDTGDETSVEEMVDLLEEEEEAPADVKRRRKRYVLNDPRKQWTHGIIPYLFDGALPQSYRHNYINVVFRQLGYWTHFRFVPWNATVPRLFNLPHSNYLRFVRQGNNCWSYLGNNPQLKGQKISCCKYSKCMHEIGHSIGFYHEETNPLRDDSVRINYQNIQAGRASSFKKLLTSGRTRGFGYYDGSSIMSYDRKAFSKNGFDTISILDDDAYHLGNTRDSTGFYMFNEAQKLYRMQATKCPDFPLTCVNDGYVSYVNGQCRCRCTSGMDHRTGCATPIGSAVPESPCGDMVNMGANNRDVTVTSPNYPANYMEDGSCTWFFNAPAGSKIKLEFTEFEMHGDNNACSGHVEIRSVLPGQPGVKYCGSGFQKTVISHSNRLQFSLASKALPSSQDKSKIARRFITTVSFITDEDLCYTADGRDNSYHGSVNITRNFKPCLPWSLVTNCRHHLFSETDVDLEQNYCRNPGDGTEPWCYTDAENCEREYCDVCKIRRCYDLFKDCQHLIATEEGFCYSHPEASRGCRKSCQLCDVTSTPKPVAFVGCAHPDNSPPDGVVVSKVKVTYAVGERLTYRCTATGASQAATRQTVCTSEGTWSYIGKVCKGGSSCVDDREDCEDLLQQTPEMCGEYRAFATTKCANTCAICSSTKKLHVKEGCVNPESSSNVSIVTRGPWTQGDLVKYVCNPGFVLKTGNLNRACQGNGHLTGNVPICIAQNEAVTELFHVPLRSRQSTGARNTVFILSNDKYRIARTGEIRAWTFYSLHSGGVQFQVWRQAPSQIWFRLIGVNYIDDTSADRLTTIHVDALKRIKVLPGDFIAIYFPSNNPGGVTFDPCKGNFNPEGLIPWVPIKKTTVWKPNLMYRMKRQDDCKLFSMSATIGPVS